MFFAFSYNVPVGWQNTVKGSQVGKQWSIIAQLHSAPNISANPAVALMADNRFHLYISGGDQSNGTKNIKVEFSDSSLNLGKWNDFITRVKFSTGSDGNVTVWRRNEGQATFRQVASANGPTIAWKTSAGLKPGDHFWKQGLYRGNDYGITNTLYMGPMARGTTFIAVENAAFGTKAGQP